MASVFDLGISIGVVKIWALRELKIASRSINDQQLIEASVRSGKSKYKVIGMEVFFRINNITTVDIFTVSQEYPTELAENRLRVVDLAIVDG